MSASESVAAPSVSVHVPKLVVSVAHRAQNEPLPSLPTLSSFDFLSWFSFKTQLTRFRLKFPSVPVPALPALLEPGILEAVQALNDDDDNKLSDDSEISKALDDVLLPTRPEDKLASLAYAKFIPASGVRLSAQLPLHYGTFKSLLESLNIADCKNAKLFARSLESTPTLFRSVSAAFDVSDSMSISEVFKVALACALRLDEASGFASVPAPPVRSVPSGSSSQAPTSAPVLSSSVSASSALPSSSVARLSDEDHARCMKDRSCFYCRQQGHKRTDCPLLQGGPVRISDRATRPPERLTLGAISCDAQDKRPFVEALDEKSGARMRALIDSGSSVTATSRGYLRRLGVPSGDIVATTDLQDGPDTVTVADGSEVDVCGAYLASLRLVGCDEPKNVCIAVLDSDQPSDHLILGTSDIGSGVVSIVDGVASLSFPVRAHAKKK